MTPALGETRALLKTSLSCTGISSFVILPQGQFVAEASTGITINAWSFMSLKDPLRKRVVLHVLQRVVLHVLQNYNSGGNRGYWGRRDNRTIQKRPQQVLLCSVFAERM